MSWPTNPSSRTQGVHYGARKLGEICDFITPGVGEFRGTRKYVATADVNYDQITNSVDITYAERLSRANVEVRENDVLVAKMAQTQKFLVATKGHSENYIFSTGFALLRTKGDLIPKYLFYFLTTKEFNEQKDQLATGATQKAINNEALKKIKISLPLIEIQKQIVERLDKIAEAQKLNDDLIQKTDELFQSLLHQELNPAGNDWEVKKLGDIAETSSGGTPLKGKTEFYENGTIPWLRSGEVSQGLIYSSELSITGKGLKQSSAKIFPINTVLVAMYGATTGQIGLLKFEATTNQAICGIFPNDKFISEYLYYFLKTKTKYLIQISTGGAQPNISQTVIRNLKVPLPDLKIQKQIVAKLSAVQEYKTQLLEQKAKLKELFGSALHKSMNSH